MCLLLPGVEPESGWSSHEKRPGAGHGACVIEMTIRDPARAALTGSSGSPGGDPTSGLRCDQSRGRPTGRPNRAQDPSGVGPPSWLKMSFLVISEALGAVIETASPH